MTSGFGSILGGCSFRFGGPFQACPPDKEL
jgi:hypothetical protein